MTARTTSHNLSHLERQAINELASNEDLIIKSADKGSGIVIEDRDKYIQAGSTHLATTQFMKR